ncbi:MAG: glycosyltransferase [Pseudomonadota bacterium]
MSDRVTIVCVPRERFDYTLESIASLYEKTTVPFDLVYVDNAVPAAVRRLLRAEAGRRGFTLVRAPYPLPPNAARNLGLEHARGRHVVFVDNDVVFDDGWLEALLACVAENRATLAAPLVCQHGPHHTIVHCAGGEFMGAAQFERFRQQPLPVPGRPEARRWTMEEEIYLQDHPIEDAGLDPIRVGFVEFHCFIVETAFLRAHGGFDPRLTATKEYIDLAMTVARAGGSVWIEPRSRVTFLTHPPQPVLKLSETPYFMLRWSDAWEYDSLKHLARKWGLVENDYFTERYARLGWRRRSELLTPISQVFRPLGKPVRKWVKRQLVRLEKPFNAYWTRRHAARAARFADRFSGERA